MTQGKRGERKKMKWWSNPIGRTDNNLSSSRTRVLNQRFRRRCSKDVFNEIGTSTEQLHESDFWCKKWIGIAKRIRYDWRLYKKSCLFEWITPRTVPPWRGVPTSRCIPTYERPHCAQQFVRTVPERAVSWVHVNGWWQITYLVVNASCIPTVMLEWWLVNSQWRRTVALITRSCREWKW